MDVVTELLDMPSKVTDHAVPDASPVSVNVTAYFVTVKLMSTCTGIPFTVTESEEGEAVYPETPTTTRIM